MQTIQQESKSDLWEILVPTMRNDKPVRTRFHRVWDEKVRKISKGLTILSPAKGQWFNKENELLVERVIPVRIMCNREQIELIADLTAAHYSQQAVMFYKISSECFVKYYEENK